MDLATFWAWTLDLGVRAQHSGPGPRILGWGSNILGLGLDLWGRGLAFWAWAQNLGGGATTLF